MGSRCPPPTQQTAALGMLGTVWAGISGFFGTIWSIVIGCLRLLIGTVVPVILAVTILFAIGCAVYGCVTVFAGSSNWSDFGSRLRTIDRERRDEKGSSTDGDIDMGSDGEIVDVLDEKKRVDIEIEFLEALLRAKRKRLESLQ
ncbi:hypothetical protein BJY01DRAFT_219018 [Aspergillus pseudoustus]|uniref:Transmembrane protein n=1 Tax=Aspergillus pseudoustus TaxID=1810923 RepID=A0ABR4JIE6_9EURO